MRAAPAAGTPAFAIAGAPLAGLRRTAARELGAPAPRGDREPAGAEPALVQDGHLLLSALAVAAYAASMQETAPALGLSKPKWRKPAGPVAGHVGVHLLFGLATAFGVRVGAALFRSGLFRSGRDRQDVVAEQ